jgi:hypothetical protein
MRPIRSYGTFSRVPRRQVHWTRCMKSFFARKMSRLTIPLAWLFVYLLLVPGTLPGLVLCFGSNGHIAVERPHVPVSHPTSQRHGPCPQSQGSCLDVLLLMEQPAEQTLVVAAGSALHALTTVLVYAVSTLQWLTALPHADTSLRPDFSPLLPPTPVPPVILRM